MRSSTLFVILFLITLVGGLIAFTPLSFVLRQSGMAERGLGWQQARGSIWHGQVTGLSWRGTPVGAINLDSDLLRMLGGGPSHHVSWVGQQGQGQADIKASRDSVLADHINLNLPLTDEWNVDPMIAQLGGSIRLSDGQVRLAGERCESAAGTVTSDVVRLAAAGFGRDWPIVSGPLGCLNGQLEADLSGKAADGTVLHMMFSQSAGLRVTVAEADDEVKANLAFAGSRDENGTLIYERPLKPEGSRP